MNASRGVCLWFAVWFVAGLIFISSAVVLDEEYGRVRSSQAESTSAAEVESIKPVVLTAAGVEVSTAGVQILLSGDGQFGYKAFQLENPHRIVLDVQGVSGPIAVSQPENHPFIERIRYAVNRHLETGVVVRYVIETSSQVDYSVKQLAQGIEVWIAAPGFTDAAVPEALEMTAPIGAPEAPAMAETMPTESEAETPVVVKTVAPTASSQAGPFLSAKSDGSGNGNAILVPMVHERVWSDRASNASTWETSEDNYPTVEPAPVKTMADADPECYPYSDGTLPAKTASDQFEATPEVASMVVTDSGAPKTVETDGYQHGVQNDTLIDHYWLRPDETIRVASLNQIQAAAVPNQVVSTELPSWQTPIETPATPQQPQEEDLFQQVIDRHYPAAKERANTEWIDPRKKAHDSAPMLTSDPDYRLADAMGSNSLPPMSMDVQGADLHTILRSIAEYAGVNIVADNDIKGALTVRVLDLPWRETLETVCRASGLVPLFESETVIRIATARSANDEKVATETAARKQEDVMPLTTRIIALEYAAAAEMKDVASSVRSLRGMVDIDTRTNSVIVTDIEPRVDLIEDMLSGLDTETMQVEITAEIVDIDITAAYQLGISWDAINLHSSSLNLDAIAAVTTDDVVDAAGEVQAGIIRDFGQIRARLQALASENKADIISTPRITTVNNRMATILVGKEVPLITLDVAGNPITELKKVGITLEVTPYLNSDEHITLDLHPEVSDLSAQSTVQGGIVFNTTEADTRVMVKDGETVVIGGLINTKTIDYNRGIPVLKDVPLLGRLFRSSDKRDEKRELLIFVTPRIVKSSSGGRFLHNSGSDE